MAKDCPCGMGCDSNCPQANKLPVLYIPNFVPNPDQALASLQKDLDWERRGDAPRSEYYVNDYPQPYVYGRGRGQREYLPRPMHPVVMAIRLALEERAPRIYPDIVSKFEVCFLNRYLNQSDQLGWHADDSPEMDDARPIVTVSLGVEREIWFKPKGKKEDLIRKAGIGDRLADQILVEKMKLGHGSACFMAPGMQDRWEHRIPKASFQCGERISLTFRGYDNNVVSGSVLQ